MIFLKHFLTNIYALYYAGVKSHLEHKTSFLCKSQMVKILVFHGDFVYFTSLLSQPNRGSAYKDAVFRDVCLDVEDSPSRSTKSCPIQKVGSARLSWLQNTGVFPHSWTSCVLLQIHSDQTYFTGIHTFNAPITNYN